MRTLPLSLGPLVSLLAFLFSLVAGCADAREPGSGVFVGPAPRLPASTAMPASDAAADASSGVMISGRVETDEGIAIIGRPIAVVDARGERTQVLSDEGGTFHVPNVARPYDLVVAGSPSGVVQTPTIFLGLTREDPFIELFERDGPTTRPAAQKLRLGVRPPACTAPSCAITVVSGSPAGGGASAMSYRDEALVLFEIDHEWTGTTIGAKESIEVHVLAFDEGRTTFSYAHRDGIRAQGGDLTELGIFEPASVPASGDLVVSAVARGPSAAWSPAIATWLDLPGGASLSFTYGAKREDTIRVPLVHGATLRANAWMQHPAVPDRPQFHSAAQAWSGTQAVAADGGALTLEIPIAPTPMRPEMDGTLSANGLGLAWTNPKSAPSALTEITIARVDTGALRSRVWTIGDEVPFAKLARLGLAPLAPGDHVIGLTSSSGDALEDLVHPDASMRRARNDPRRGGATTYQRFRFTVTP